MPRNRTRLLLITNIVTAILLLCGTAAVLRRRHLSDKAQAAYDRPLPYNKNPAYIEELDFYALYTGTRPAIVMLGTSLTRKVEWSELLRRCDVANRGVHRAITEGLLAGIPDVVRMGPKIVFIEGGSNDVDRRLPTAEVAGRFETIAGRLSAAGIVPVLMYTPYVAAFYPKSAEINDSIGRLNVRLAAIAKEKRLEVVNINSVMAPCGVALPQFVRGDGCHLTSLGYRLWQAEVQRILEARGI